MTMNEKYFGLPSNEVDVVVVAADSTELTIFGRINIRVRSGYMDATVPGTTTTEWS